MQRLWLTDFRNFASAELELDEGLTVVIGRNGQGKTNLLEAVAYLAELGSFRGVSTDDLVRAGMPSAVVRAEGERDGRSLLVEAEINRVGRNRVMVNRQRLQRSRDLLGAMRVSVFAPDDLAVVKGGPGLRRDYLDATLVSARPRLDELRLALEKILRQRNALLRQSGGRLSDDVAVTLDVWDARLAETGEKLAAARAALVERLAPAVAAAYERLAEVPSEVSVRYEPWWRQEGLAAALVVGRDEDLRRGVTGVGPHRDDLELAIGGMPARSQASQGEQRTLALALRLAAHEVVTDEAGSAPVLLLDDVFSELDPARQAALVRWLPEGQTLLTTAGDLPAGIAPGRVLTVEAGTLRPGGPGGGDGVDGGAEPADADGGP
ncbi:MAG: DNA replication/repair protein RecF [Acidimicrobiia bacterium]|nr:DNA replication/repair protein RecF [Acidimicrobiia bacterium]